MSGTTITYGATRNQDTDSNKQQELAGGCSVGSESGISSRSGSGSCKRDTTHHHPAAARAGDPPPHTLLIAGFAQYTPAEEAEAVARSWLRASPRRRHHHQYPDRPPRRMPSPTPRSSTTVGGRRRRRTQSATHIIGADRATRQHRRARHMAHAVPTPLSPGAHFIAWTLNTH